MTFGELPVTLREFTQRLRKTSEFAPPIDYDDDEYDMSYPPLSSSSAYDASASSSSSSRGVLVSHASPLSESLPTGTKLIQCGNRLPKKLSPKKEEKRYTHDFKKAIVESEKMNRLQRPTRSDTVPLGDSTSSSSITGPGGIPIQYIKTGRRTKSQHTSTPTHVNSPHPTKSQPRDLASYPSNRIHRQTSPYLIHPPRNESDISN